MARRFAKVLEQEIVAINEAEFWRLGIYPPLFPTIHLPFRGYLYKTLMSGI